MKKPVLIFLGLSLGLLVLAQPNVVPNNIRSVNTLEKLYDPDGLGRTDMLYGIPQPEGKVVGDTYFSTQWKASTILLYKDEKMVEGFLTRYDIRANEIEVKTQSGIKIVSGDKVKSFIWIDSVSRVPSYFVNAKDFKDKDQTTLSGFFQVVVDGPLPLLKQTTVYVKKADYSVQFDVGSRDDKILKKTELYFARDGQVMELPSSKKKLLPLFGDKAEAIGKFIQDQNLTVSREADLVTIFNHYNGLITAN
ncbi:hypothetical protein SAMN04488109_4515 [Chryseolinea serpens]|uniref:Uncharacterized protein n=1 Tax=Chryseolinea serpens TaxID=947013 RepID=A0A1M5U8U0_9BACT|nr:hypothetical protein [Chryseolinea serpens]SHH59093.1 hypothetical protein SAMN04488109_4515 [Chryseolinea serpens]